MSTRQLQLIHCHRCAATTLHKANVCIDTTCGATNYWPGTSHTSQAADHHATALRAESHRRMLAKQAERSKARRDKIREGRKPLGRPRAMELTTLELKVSALLDTGITQNAVAAQMGVTRAAVASTVMRAMKRVGAMDSAELRRYARSSVATKGVEA